MAKTSGDFEKEFIDTAKLKTDKSLEQWLAVVKETDFSKQMEMLNWLKKVHKINHLQAGIVASIFLNNGKPFYINEDYLLENNLNRAKPCDLFSILFHQKI